MANVNPKHERSYALGNSESEFKRLEIQAAFIRDLTEDVLKRAGVSPGMRVLDIGCGVGDVSLLAGSLVGPTGSVIGVDRSREAIDTARRRASAAGHDRLNFEQADLATFEPNLEVDAIIGRLVLMYMPDPA